VFGRRSSSLGIVTSAIKYGKGDIFYEICLSFLRKHNLYRKSTMINANNGSMKISEVDL
jgi:hypothetical protein